MSELFPEFLMEDWLEKYRFSARFNAGESGHFSQNLGTVLRGLQPDFEFDLREALFETMLNDAPNMGIEELRVQVAQLHPGATPDQVLITTGTSEALFLLLRQLAPKKVALIVPAFQLLIEVPRALHASILPLPLEWCAEGRPSAPIDHWCELLKKHKPDVLILNHPHNPSGLNFSKKELEPLLAIAESLGSVVIGDEHYRFLASSDSFVGPTLYAPGRFVTGSFIKCSGTPGLRIGWCVGDVAVLKAMQSEKNYLTHTVNPMSQKIAFWFLQSLGRRQEFYRQMHKTWNLNRSHLAEWFGTQPVWRGEAPSGGLVTCVFPRTTVPARQVFERLIHRGAFLLPLSTFMDSFSSSLPFCDGYRLGLGLPHDDFKQLLSVMVTLELS